MRKILLTLFFALLIPFFGIDSADAQTACVTPPTNTGRVTLSATATAGTYRVWARMKVPSTSANSFYIQIGNCARLVGGSTSIPVNSWTWVDYQSGTSTNKINYDLTAGTHVVTVIGNQPGVGVDKILMTKNLSCVPTGTSGDNCPAEIALTPTPTIGAADTTPPVISNPRTESVTTTSVQVKWELNEYASGQVEYRPLGSTTWLSTSLQTCCQYNYHIQTITGLTNGTTYEYRVKSADVSENMSTSSICRFTAGGPATQACAGGSTPTNAPTSTLTPTRIPTNVPTSTLTPTPVPNSTILRFNSVKLHGIGTGGDNSNVNSAGNSSPLRTSRTATIELIDSAGNTLPVISGNVTYKSATGDFGGDIVVTGATIPSGSYLIKVKSPGYLKKQLTGIINIVPSTTNTLPNVTLITGDINNDNSLSISDYNVLLDCYSDLLPARNCSDQNKKMSADLSDDGSVNASDYNLFLRELSVVSGN